MCCRSKLPVRFVCGCFKFSHLSWNLFLMNIIKKNLLLLCVNDFGGIRQNYSASPVWGIGTSRKAQNWKKHLLLLCVNVLMEYSSHNCFYYTSKPECAIPDGNEYSNYSASPVWGIGTSRKAQNWKKNLQLTIAFACMRWWVWLIFHRQLSCGSGVLQCSPKIQHIWRQRHKEL
jgi:hypothetical protein